MTDTEKSERPAKDLSVPETMKIAALLAELMPSTVPATAPAPAPALSKPPPQPEDSVPVISPGKLAIDEIDAEPPSVLVTPLSRSHSGERRITATVTTQP